MLLIHHNLKCSLYHNVYNFSFVMGFLLIKTICCNHQIHEINHVILKHLKPKQKSIKCEKQSKQLFNKSAIL